jgi:hypothetical protein
MCACSAGSEQDTSVFRHGSASLAPASRNSSASNIAKPGPSEMSSKGPVKKAADSDDDDMMDFLKDDSNF